MAGCMLVTVQAHLKFTSHLDKEIDRNRTKESFWLYDDRRLDNLAPVK